MGEATEAADKIAWAEWVRKERHEPDEQHKNWDRLLRDYKEQEDKEREDKEREDKEREQREREAQELIIVPKSKPLPNEDMQDES